MSKVQKVKMKKNNKNISLKAHTDVLSIPQLPSSDWEKKH